MNFHLIEVDVVTCHPKNHLQGMPSDICGTCMLLRCGRVLYDQTVCLKTVAEHALVLHTKARVTNQTF